LNAAAQSNLPNTNWFDEIDSALQLQLLSEIAANSGIAALADEPRDVWRNLLFSFADAEHRGATGAREVALAWCKTSARFQSEVDFNRDWNSFNTRPGGITVATLLDAAAKVGYDLEPWRQVADGASIAAPATTVEASPSAPASGPAAAQSLAISALPTVMAPDHALDLLNQMFFFAHDWGGEPLVGHVRSDGVRPITEQHFHAMLANRYARIPSADPDAKPRKLVLGKWWLVHPRRSEFDWVIYDPEEIRSPAGERAFNLWVGFARTPRRGDWKLMARHIHSVVCKRDREIWRYLIRWLAHAVQRPGTAPGTVPVLKSDAEGTGKSSVLEWMARMYGEQALMLNTPEDFIGEFNDHLENKSLIGLNEPSFPGDHRAAWKLKSMITEPTWLLNGKFRKARRMPNIAHIMLTTNASWAVPAGNQARRFLVLDVDEGRSGDRAYFKTLWAEADTTGIEAIFYALGRIDLSSFDPRDVPKTSALRQQQLRSATTTTQWATDAVECGEFVSTASGNSAVSYAFGAKYSSIVLYGAYKNWADGMRQRPVSHVEFGRWLKRCEFPRTMVHGTPTYDIPDAATFGAKVCRQAGIL
jgi:hypothetical protein